MRKIHWGVTPGGRVCQARPSTAALPAKAVPSRIQLATTRRTPEVIRGGSRGQFVLIYPTQKESAIGTQRCARTGGMDETAPQHRAAQHTHTRYARSFPQSIFLHLPFLLITKLHIPFLIITCAKGTRDRQRAHVGRLLVARTLQSRREDIIILDSCGVPEHEISGLKVQRLGT